MKFRFISFSGKMTAGKTTIAELFVKNFGFKRMAIGDQIKHLANLVIENKSEMEYFLKKYKASNELLLDFENLSKQMKGREFIKENGIYKKNEHYRYLTQKTGDLMRGYFGDDVWVKILFNRANEEIKKGKKVVCDDVRLKVEYDLFKENHIPIIRLEVEPDIQKERIIKLYNNFSEEALKHRTETELDNAEFLYIFDTTVDTPQQTFEKVCFALKNAA